MAATLIPGDEYQARMSRLQESVAGAGLDLFLVSAEESIQYLTGVSYTPLERPFFILVRPRGRPALLVPMLERDHLAQTASVQQVTTSWDYPSLQGEGWAERLLELIGGNATIGIEPTLPAEIGTVLAGLDPAVLPLVERLRLHKSPDEIELLRHAARNADLGVERALGVAYRGASVLELFGQGRSVQTRMLQEVGYDPLLSSVLVGAWPAPGSAMPHDVPSVGTKLEDGPTSLWRSSGCTAIAPSASARPLRRRRTVRLGLPLRSCSRRGDGPLPWPGAACAEIDAAANGFLRDEGYSDNLMHRTGHGFGLSTHEGPWVAQGSEDVLEAGMLISVEPGIYLPGVGGVRHSDTVLITEDGHECLTRYPTDLESLTIGGARPWTRLMGVVTRRVAGV
jgi:Xaa-Pro aminopeptidase